MTLRSLWHPVRSAVAAALHQIDHMRQMEPSARVSYRGRDGRWYWAHICLVCHRISDVVEYVPAKHLDRLDTTDDDDAPPGSGAGAPWGGG